jgi:hypothetical protein
MESVISIQYRQKRNLYKLTKRCEEKKTDTEREREREKRGEERRGWGR